jgi:hypothetical protein
MKLCLHAEIAAAALLRDEEYALRDWYLARAAANGQGHCRVDQFRAFLRARGFRRTQIAKIIKGLVATGMASRRFTTYGQEVLYLLPLRKMIDRYGLGSVRWRVNMPLQELKGKALRQTLFAYVKAGLGESLKARSTLRAITGVSEPTQIRGQKRTGAQVKPNFVRVDLSTIDRMPCVAEGHEGHRTFRHDGSVFIQTVNSVSYPTIPRRKRVVHGTDGHCSDYRAQQPTLRRRYFSDVRKARKQGKWRAMTVDGESLLPVVVAEPDKRLGRELVGVFGLV